MYLAFDPDYQRIQQNQDEQNRQQAHLDSLIREMQPRYTNDQNFRFRQNIDLRQDDDPTRGRIPDFILDREAYRPEMKITTNRQVVRSQPPSLETLEKHADQNSPELNTYIDRNYQIARHQDNYDNPLYQDDREYKNVEEKLELHNYPDHNEKEKYRSDGIRANLPIAREYHQRVFNPKYNRKHSLEDTHRRHNQNQHVAKPEDPRTINILNFKNDIPETRPERLLDGIYNDFMKTHLELNDSYVLRDPKNFNRNIDEGENYVIDAKSTEDKRDLRSFPADLFFNSTVNSGARRSEELVPVEYRSLDVNVDQQRGLDVNFERGKTLKNLGMHPLHVTRVEEQFKINPQAERSFINYQKPLKNTDFLLNYDAPREGQQIEQFYRKDLQTRDQVYNFQPSFDRRKMNYHQNDQLRSTNETYETNFIEQSNKNFQEYADGSNNQYDVNTLALPFDTNKYPAMTSGEKFEILKKLPFDAEPKADNQVPDRYKKNDFLRERKKLRYQSAKHVEKHLQGKNVMEYNLANRQNFVNEFNTDERRLHAFYNNQMLTL